MQEGLGPIEVMPFGTTPYSKRQAIVKAITREGTRKAFRQEQLPIREQGEAQHLCLEHSWVGFKGSTAEAAGKSRAKGKQTRTTPTWRFGLGSAAYTLQEVCGNWRWNT